MGFGFLLFLIICVVVARFISSNKAHQDHQQTPTSKIFDDDETGATKPAIWPVVSDDGAEIFAHDDDPIQASMTNDVFTSESTFGDDFDDTLSPLNSDPGINPATGLPMLSEGGIDVAGNPFGVDLSSSVHDDSFGSSISRSPLFDDDLHSSINHSAFDDSMSTGFDDDLFQDDLHDPFNSNFDDW